MIECNICFHEYKNTPENNIFKCDTCSNDTYVCLLCHDQLTSHRCPFCRVYNWRRRYNVVVLFLELSAILKQLK